MTKDLILTYATDIEYSSLRRLIVSARRVCPPELVDIIVIINPLGNRFAELAQEYDVQLFPCNSIWKEIRPYKAIRLFYRVLLIAATVMERYPELFGSADVCSQLHRSLAAPWLHASSQRYTIIEDILRVRSTYRLVFLTDARDVVLQSNPFEDLDEDKLHVFLQHGVVYGEDNLDTNWINNVMGVAAARRFSGREVSCCGTTIGGQAVMLSYLKKMTAAILKYQFSVVDQVPHNEIIYSGWPSERISFHPNTEGLVLTLGGMTAADVELTETTVRLGGRVVPVVHMYDRVPEIKELFHTLYPD